MDLKKIFIKDACPTKIGGQAVLDGIMMKGEDRTSVVVRLPGNQMHIKTTKLAPLKKAAQIPVVRGVYIFVSTLVVGMKTLMYSAEVSEKYFEEDDDDEASIAKLEAIRDKLNENPVPAEDHVTEADDENSENSDRETVIEAPAAGVSSDNVTSADKATGADSSTGADNVTGADSSTGAGSSARADNVTGADSSTGAGSSSGADTSSGGVSFTTMIIASVALAIAFVVGFFIILPTFAVNFLDNYIHSDIAMNLIEGVLRIVMFVLYILVVSKMEDIRTVFRYHGAEHKTIHCFENGLELTPENAEKFETLHPRCGTSFLMFVMVISLLLFSLLGWPNLLVRIASRILLIPLIAGLSYELLRAAGQGTSTLVKILSVPGLLLQYLTTKEPTRDQLEVAIAALKAVLVSPDTPLIEGICDKNGELIPEGPTIDEAVACEAGAAEGGTSITETRITEGVSDGALSADAQTSAGADETNSSREEATSEGIN